MMWISSPSAASAIRRRAVSSTSTSVARSSVERQTRETSEVTTIAPMKSEAILTPSGRSKTLTMVV